MGYLISKNFQESGPYEINSLQDMVKSGKIEADYWACKDGSKKWIEITKIPELKGLFSAQPKPAGTQSVKKNSVPKKK
jgi:hypothetical protein